MPTGSVLNISRLVVLPHSVFALPFAVVGYLLALRVGRTVEELSPSVEIFVIVLAVVFARTAAMAFNRYLDSDIDALNPRTSMREIPQRVLSKQFVLILTFISSALFFLCAGILGNHCLALSPIVLFVLLFYSYLKRFSRYSHIVLGLALALAPGGAWWVVRPSVELLPIVLMLAVTFWVAGFDIIYSCQDVDFDRENQLFSIPAKLGTETALKISLAFHWITGVLFLLLGSLSDFGAIYFLGVIALIVVLLRQHRLVTPTDFTRANRAFFTFNGFISIAYLGLVILSLKV